eukprot:COSAG06_NODE_2369_length_6995_cov_7.327001_4_plen_163_part_00
MQDGGGGAVAEPGAADALGFEPPDWYGLVWPAVESLPEAWLEQGLSFSEGSQELIQPKNGPCGVLAAVHGVVVARELAAGRAVEPKTPVTDGTSSVPSQRLSFFLPRFHFKPARERCLHVSVSLFLNAGSSNNGSVSSLPLERKQPRWRERSRPSCSSVQAR